VKPSGNKIEFSRDATFANTIVLAADNNFVPYALFFIDQIANAHPDRDFDFCLLTQDDIAPHQLIDKHGIRICKFTHIEMESHLPKSGHISTAAFLRIFAPEFLVADYKRMLYLDCDMFYRRGDLSKLITADIGDHAVAAARDPIQYRRKNHTPKDMRDLGLGYFRFLSSGLMLIDIERFNAAGYAEKMIGLAVELAAGDQVFLDQSIINAVLKGDWAELPLTWNWLYNFRSIYYTELFDPAILHFVGRRKAWNHLNGEYPAKYADAYRAFFKQHFPAMYQAMPASQPPSNAKRGHLRYFIKHALDLRRFVPEMDRFKHDFDIKL